MFLSIIDVELDDVDACTCFILHLYYSAAAPTNQQTGMPLHDRKELEYILISLIISLGVCDRYRFIPDLGISSLIPYHFRHIVEKTLFYAKFSSYEDLTVCFTLENFMDSNCVSTVFIYIHVEEIHIRPVGSPFDRQNLADLQWHLHLIKAI